MSSIDKQSDFLKTTARESTALCMCGDSLDFKWAFLCLYYLVAGTCALHLGLPLWYWAQCGATEPLVLLTLGWALRQVPKWMWNHRAAHLTTAVLLFLTTHTQEHSPSACVCLWAYNHSLVPSHRACKIYLCLGSLFNLPVFKGDRIHATECLRVLIWTPPLDYLLVLTVMVQIHSLPLWFPHPLFG